MGKLIMKKSILPLILIILVSIIGMVANIQWYITLGTTLVIAVDLISI